MALFKANYDKPGPGVDKNAPKKAPIAVFFEIYARKFWKLILANMLYVLVSLPVVTVGLANAGLTYITRNFAREKHAFIAGDFFDTIRKNWKQALSVGLINLIVGVALAYAIYFYYNMSAGLFGTLLMAFVLVVALLYVFMQYYLYVLMITFHFSLKQLYKNSIIMAASCWKPNLIISVVMVAVYAAIIGICLVLPMDIAIAVALFLYVLWIPAFQSYLTQFCVFPSVKTLLIDPYYKEHPGEDKDKLRALGLEVEDDDAEQEAVFVDQGNEQRRAEEEAAKKAKWTFPTPYPNRPNDEEDDTI